MTRDRRRFERRVAVVTGGAGGLGRAVCAGLASEGAVVAVVDVAADAVEEAVAVLGESGGQAVGFACDVADPVSVSATTAAVVDRLGQPTVLVNLAGGSLGTPRDLPDIEVADFDLVVGVNLRGTFLACQAVVPQMREAGGGAIVNVSSIGGRTSSPVTGVPYAAAKAGVLGLTRRLAREVGPDGIRVNALAPGLFLSGPRLHGMWEALPEAERQGVIDATPLRRMPDAREAVDPVLFLASEEASYITGTVLDVNGGRFMAG